MLEINKKPDVDTNNLEIRCALFEYNIAVDSINQTAVFGYEFQLQSYEVLKCTDKHLATDKRNVYFQTSFLEETYKNFLYNKKDIKKTLKELSIWHKNLINNQKKIDWDVIIDTANPNNLEEIFRLYSDKMSDEIYWKTVAHCYTSSNLGHSETDTILLYLKDNNRANRHFLMSTEEQLFLKNLPQIITIYRGCSKKEIESGKIRFSWTLDRKIAEFFAFNYKNGFGQSSKEDNEVIEKVINKKDVIAYFNERNEEEILYFLED